MNSPTCPCCGNDVISTTISNYTKTTWSHCVVCNCEWAESRRTASRAGAGEVCATCDGSGVVSPAMTGRVSMSIGPCPDCAAPSRAGLVGGWRGIDSCPEDADVLGYFPDAWHKVRRFRKFTRDGGIVWTIETQAFSDPGSRMPHDKLPTHWMPIPPPPVAAAKGVE